MTLTAVQDNREPGASDGVPSPLTWRLAAVLEHLVEGIVERDVAVRLTLLAALAGEHVLLLGPPGTGKSLISRRLNQAFSNASYFERLLTRFTVPEELFGPLSIKGLEQDRYERLTQGYVPKAAVAFLDEIFKANSAILNALLTLLNEREFDNGTRRERTPLLSLVGASNELPEGDELGALYDRFLVRIHVGPVSQKGFAQLLSLRGEPQAQVPEELKLTPDDLRALQAEAQNVKLSADVIALLSELRAWCAAEQVAVSDRRWRKIVKLLQVAAKTNGRDAVSIWDCWLLQHCIWNRPEEREKVYDWYAAHVGTSAVMDMSALARTVGSWEGRLKRDQESRSQALSKDLKPLYIGQDEAESEEEEETRPRYRGGEKLYLAPANAQSSHYGRTTSDRRNGGEGYTEHELDQLYVDGHYFPHWSKRDAYLAEPSNWLTVTGKRTPLLEPTRQKPAHIESCLREIDKLARDVERYRDEISRHRESLEQTIRDHLWVSSNFVEPAVASLTETQREVAGLSSGLAKVRKGFELLPLEGGERESETSEPRSTRKLSKRDSHGATSD